MVGHKLGQTEKAKYIDTSAPKNPRMWEMETKLHVYQVS